MRLSAYVGDRLRLISSLSSSAFSVTFLCCLKCTNSAQKCTLLQLLYLKGLIFLKIAESFGIFQFYSLYQIDKIPPDSFKAEMKDNEANTRQNIGFDLYCFFDRIDRIDRMFRMFLILVISQKKRTKCNPPAARRPFGRRPFYPDNPAVSPPSVWRINPACPMESFYPIPSGSNIIYL
jgi:hypothetical protein